MPRTTRKKHPRRKLRTYRKKAKSYKKRTHRRVKRGGKYVDGFGFEMDSPKRKRNSSGSYGFGDEFENEQIFTSKKRKSPPPPLVGDFREAEEIAEEVFVPKRGTLKYQGAIKKKSNSPSTRKASIKGREITTVKDPYYGKVTTFGV